MPRVEQVIISETSRGKGEDESDPIRSVVQVHNFAGELIAEWDAWEQERALHKRLGNFSRSGFFAKRASDETPEFLMEGRWESYEDISAMVEYLSSPEKFRKQHKKTFHQFIQQLKMHI